MHCFICLGSDGDLRLSCAEGTCHGLKVHSECLRNSIYHGNVHCTVCDTAYAVTLDDPPRRWRISPYCVLNGMCLTLVCICGCVYVLFVRLMVSDDISLFAYVTFFVCVLFFALGLCDSIRELGRV